MGYYYLGRNHMEILTRTVNRAPQIILTTLLVLILIAWNPVSAQSASIAGEVMDETTGEPVEDAQVTVAFSENGTVVATTYTDSAGNFQVTGLSSGSYNVSIQALGFLYYSEELDVVVSPIFEETTYFIEAKLEPESRIGIETPDSGEFPYMLLFQTLVIITIILIVSLVMYSKIKRENLLKNALRKRIFDYIKDNPGLHYRAILTDLDLSMGVLTYHLNRLEKALYIKSRQDGMFRRFYVSGRKTDMRFFLSNIQESILNVIKENKGISQSKIAEKISVSRKVVNYHINILNKAGLIFVENHGRETACFPTEDEVSKADSGS
jgi:DNA-binding MarR family transcriptional regulator